MGGGFWEARSGECGTPGGGEMGPKHKGPSGNGRWAVRGGKWG